MMNPPYNNKTCPRCKTRQLVSLQIDAGQCQLGVAFFYCDECLELYASEGIEDTKPRLDMVVFTGTRQSVEATIEFYETLQQFYKLLAEFLDGAAKNRRLMMLALHAATILRHEAWEAYEECEFRLSKLQKIANPKRKRKK